MNRTYRASGLAVLATVSSVVFSGSAAAQNVIPGDNSPARTVIVDPTKGAVNVKPSGDSSVSFTFQNLTGSPVRCQDETNTYSSVATEPEVAQKVVAYYKNFGVLDKPVIPLAVSSVNIPIDLSPVLLLLPGGSLAPLFGNNHAALADIKAAQENAAQRGHVGQITPFNIANGATTPTYTIPIAPPSAGSRTDWNASVVITCKTTSGPEQWFAFVGYEDGEPMAPPGGALNIGSLGRY
ncbi:Hypothetical protein BJL86_1405 [Dietzia timorensis]|uniref:Secreted protein n=1 Tax=Dietzia timorensis TaxID=499555 RepID=A0A173LLJ6_9ACTN|nr:Hypothetical protein BJL86_1405 [Dietzia timorensis]